MSKLFHIAFDKINPLFKGRVAEGLACRGRLERSEVRFSVKSKNFILNIDLHKTSEPISNE